jgi:CubicO group peptidase (beta-lactamase class C family)
MLLRGGRIVAERYAAGTSVDTPMAGGSAGKCVTALLVGLLVADGRLKLDAPAAIPAWQRPGDPRSAITPRMLLQMRSGLRHTELGDDGDAARMLRGEGQNDMAAYAEGEPMAAPAGQRSNYSSADTIVLADLAARTLAPDGDFRSRQSAVAEYLRTRLFVPARLGSMVAGYDAHGTMIGATNVQASPRDWARLGELLRSDGAVGGAQLLPRGWIAFMRRPSPVDPEMGAQLWLNHRTDEDGSLLPGRAPPGVFACAGAGGQFVIVSPAQRATLVRLGASGDGGSGVLTRRLADILRALPGYGPGRGPNYGR